MKLFRCELISKKGLVLERFFREAETAKEIKENLDIFQWPKNAHWEITIYKKED